MENNIDKDIEIVKGIKRTSLTGGFDKQTIRLNAISNVLKDLEYNKKQFAVQLDEKLTLKSECEKWKKIAEKLAEHIIITDVKDSICESFSEEECEKVEIGRCDKCIIDWARNEVEKDD